MNGQKFHFTIIFVCASLIAMPPSRYPLAAQEETNNRSRKIVLTDKKGRDTNLCKMHQINLLSCEIENKKTISVCLGKYTNIYSFDTRSSNGTFNHIYMNGAKQDNIISQDEPTTVIEWNKKDGAIRLYIFRVLDADNLSVTGHDKINSNISHDHVIIRIKVRDRYADSFCRLQTISMPISNWAPLGKQSMGGISIWELNSLGLASNYNFDADTDGGWPTIPPSG